MLFPAAFLLVLVAGLTAALEKNLKFPFDLPKGYGPWVHPTAGQVWPQPQLQNTSSNFMVLRPNVFKFQVRTILENLCSPLTHFNGYFMGF